MLSQSSTDHRHFNMFTLSVVVCICLVFVAATDVLQCPGNTIEGLKDKVQLTPCKKQPCRLKKGTNQHIKINFVPEKDMADVKNVVTADVFGVNLPFVGVDGLSVCEKIETEDGEKAPCPLKAGTKYVYKDSFPILSFYPSIEAKVHWALRHGENDDIICFEVPVKIA